MRCCRVSGFEGLISQFSKNKDLIPRNTYFCNTSLSSTLIRISDARGGSSQHRQDSHSQAFAGGGKNNKNTKLFKALLHEPLLPFKAPVRILVPSAFYVALQKVQHQATKIPTLSRLWCFWTCSTPVDPRTPFCIREPLPPPFISLSNEAKQERSHLMIPGTL